MIHKVAKLSARARDLVTAVNRGLETAEGDARALMVMVRDRMVTKRGGAYQQPMLTSQISYLASMIDAADQKLGNHAYMRYDKLLATLTACEEAFEAAR